MEARETRRDAFLGGNYAATRRVRLLARRNARDITFWLSLKEGGGGGGSGVDLPAFLVYIPACNNLIEIMPVVVE